MNLLEFVVLARIGNYGPHIVAIILMVSFIFYLAHKLKLPNYQFILFILFAWNLHEVLSQFTMNFSNGNFGIYLFNYGNYLAGLAIIACGFYVFHERMNFRPVPWLGLAIFLLIYMSIGWPTTFPPHPIIFAVGVLENLYHASFALAFWSLFYG